MDWEEVNPRYKAWCFLNGAKSVDEMHRRDKHFVPYMQWNDKMLNVWLKENNKTRLYSEEDHDQYSNWLLAYVYKQLELVPADKLVQETMDI